MFWSGLHTLNFIFSTLFGLLAIYAITGIWRNGRWSEMGWRQYLCWVIPYFCGLWLISWIGPKSLGGIGTLTFFPSMGVVAVLSVSIFYVALHQAVSDQQINAYMLQFAYEIGHAP